MPRSVKVTTSSDVFAAVPHLLQYVPEESFVLIIVGSDPARPNRTEMAARVSLQQFDQDPSALARLLTRPVMDRPVREVIGLVVCPALPGPGLPYRTYVLALAHEIRQLGFRVDEVSHVPDFSEGALWRSYVDMERSGHLPDPFSTPIAAATVAEGIVTARSRDALVGAFSPAAETDRARLEPHIISALAQSRADRDQSDAARDRLARADTAIAAASYGVLPTGDTELADLIATFSIEPFRSAAFSVDSTDLLHGVETLTTHLWRFAPEPCASHLAAVIALHAYLLGAGARASIAVDAGTVPLPLLGLLRHALATQVPHGGLRVAVSEGSAEARAHLITPKRPESPESVARPVSSGDSDDTFDRLEPDAP
ncbi:DUF4192 domain-containing protein [Amycolatopsis sp. lyj-108]|uniref:DUF4192 domain-containing protein n=1 Tax=Amycolatopsis sp. lyj-108 TaxID=2789286 RepID=UPI00397B5534